ncbi:condensin-2 complex subunit H2-like [Mytilus galloprovincialis]|uniref:condensin-2 complex subunit H2-like n=1 Tax=Mytilus galloprovincialis TaxID=29158 RepID=UPI003F7B7394
MTISASQTQGDLETRFSQLIQPIRDLTKNWDVNIAEQLEDYLSELEKVTITFDGGLTTMNFAEAAMVIQGSACVYSKKVEYLYTLVYQTLDLLANKKKQKTGNEDGNNNEDDQGDNDGEDEEFLTLDDIQEHKNIVLKEESDDKCIPPIPQMPLSLIPFDDCDKGDKPLLSKSGEVLASRNDFKMNTCSVHTTGTLLLDMTHLALLKKSLQMSFSTHESMHIDPHLTDSEPNSIPNNVDQANMSVDHDDNDNAFEPPLEDLMDMPQSDDINMPPTDEVDGGPHVEEVHQNAMETGDAATEDIVELKRSSRNKQVKLIPPKQIVNLWEPIDPHDAGKIVERPFKKGTSFLRIPACLEDPTSKKRKRRPAPPKQLPLTEFIMQQNSQRSKFPKNKLKCPTFPEFEQKYYEEYKRRLSIHKNERKLRTFIQEDIEEEEEEDDVENMIDDPIDEGLGFDAGDNVDLDESPLIDDKLFQAMELAMESHHGGFEVSRRMSEAQVIDKSTVISDYEELVRQHVDQYLASAQEYAQITELSQRVSEWEDKVLPKLAEEDERPPFDINIYGTFIIDNLEKKKSKPFTQIVKHKQTYDVCRTFLASLMLANTSNVKIHQVGNFDEGIDKYELELLTTVRHFEQLEEYQAPSIASS